MIPFIPSILSGVIVTAVLVKAVTSVVPGVEIKDWTPAFIVAGVAAIVGYATGMLEPVLAAQGLSIWVQLGVSYAISTVVLAILLATVPGITTSGPVSVVIAAILVKALGFAIATAYVQLMTAGFR